MTKKLKKVKVSIQGIISRVVLDTEVDNEQFRAEMVLEAERRVNHNGDIRATFAFLNRYTDDPVLKRIHEILWNDWNPLRTEGLPEDEYYTYEKEVRTLLLYGGGPAAIAFRLYIAEYGMFHGEAETQAELKKKYVPTQHYDRLMELGRKIGNRALRGDDDE